MFASWRVLNLLFPTSRGACISLHRMVEMFRDQSKRALSQRTRVGEGGGVSRKCCGCSSFKQRGVGGMLAGWSWGLAVICTDTLNLCVCACVCMGGGGVSG